MEMSPNVIWTAATAIAVLSPALLLIIRHKRHLIARQREVTKAQNLIRERRGLVARLARSPNPEDRAQVGKTIDLIRTMAERTGIELSSLVERELQRNAWRAAGLHETPRDLMKLRFPGQNLDLPALPMSPLSEKVIGYENVICLAPDDTKPVVAEEYELEKQLFGDLADAAAAPAPPETTHEFIIDMDTDAEPVLVIEDVREATVFSTNGACEPHCLELPEADSHENGFIVFTAEEAETLVETAFTEPRPAIVVKREVTLRLAPTGPQTLSDWTTENDRDPKNEEDSTN